MKIDRFNYNALKNEIKTIYYNCDLYRNSFTDAFEENYSYFEKEIKIFKNELLNSGIDLDIFFYENKDKIFRDEDFISVNAFWDILLYSYDSKIAILGGDKLIDKHIPNEEFFVKYQYGYCNYDMGKRYILQSYKTIDEYYFDTAKKLLSGVLNFQGYMDNELEKVLDSYQIIKKFDDGYIILFNMSLICTFNKYDKMDFVDDVSPIMCDIVDDDYMIVYVGYDDIIPDISMSDFDDNKIKNMNIELQSKKYNL